jgi:Ca-activated chloride channel family protein
MRLAFALALLFALGTHAGAQSGRNRPDPQASPTPAAQQRPRRAMPARDAEDSQPGQPASPNTPSQTPANKSSQPDANDDEVLLVNSNLVPVSANVTDAAGHAITDLKIEDFELRVDGQPKPISDISHAETPVRIAFLFDNSSSIRPTRELEKQAAVNFFRTVLRPVDQAAIFSISTIPTLDQPLTNDVRRLVSTIESYGKVDDASTPLFDTIVMAADYLRSQPGRKVMIIVSDGVETTSNLQDFGEMVRRVLASDCEVFVIQTGLSENANLRDLVAERRMQDLTSYTGGFVNVPHANADLEAAFTQIAADLSQQYVLSYYPNDDARDGRFRVISLRVKSRPNLRVRARRGYYPRHAENLSALPQNFSTGAGTTSQLPISDPALTPMTAQSNSPREVAANVNTGATVNANASTNARAHVITSATTHGSKNLDPDAGGTSDDDASAKQTVRLGSFNPTQSPSAAPSQSSANDSPPPRGDANQAHADTRSQPDPPTSQPANDRPNTTNSSPITSTVAPSVSTAQLSSSTDAPAPTNAKPADAPSNKPSNDANASQQKQPAPTSQSSQPKQSASSQSPQPPQSSVDEPAKKPIVAGGVLNSRAKSLPVPAYPATAQHMRVVGTVVVEVLVDESGRVVEARAASGHALLREAAVEAAKRARFAPVLVGGQPARMTGFLNYTFTL